MDPAREAGSYHRKVAHTEVLTLLETHVGHGVIHSLEGRSRYVTTAHLAGKGTGPASLLLCGFMLVPNQYAPFSRHLSSSDDLCSLGSLCALECIR